MAFRQMFLHNNRHSRHSHPNRSNPNNNNSNNAPTSSWRNKTD